MTIFIIFWVAVAVIFVLWFGFTYLWDYIDSKYIIPKKVEKQLIRVESKAREMSKYQKGIYLVEDGEDIFVYKNGEAYYNIKNFNYPLFKRADGIYTEEESEGCIYVGYCQGNVLHKNKNRNGIYGNFDSLGNPITVSNSSGSYSGSYISDDYYDTGSSGGYVEDNSYASNLRVDWRPDGSFGSIFERDGHQYDEWGNEL